MYNFAVAARHAVLGLLISLIAASPGLAASPIEAYATVPDTSRLHLSPDGKHIAAIQPYHGRPQAVTFEFTPAGVQRSVLEIPDAVARDVVWAGNDRLVAVYSKNMQIHYDNRLRMWVKAFSMNAHAQDVVQLMGHTVIGDINVNSGSIADVAIDDPAHVYIEAYGIYPSAALNIYSVDLKNGEPTPLVDGRYDTIQWVMDGHGHVIARVDQNSVTSKNELMLGGPGSWETVATFDVIGGREAYVHGLSEDGKSLLLEQIGDRDTIGLYPFDLATRKLGAPVFSDPHYDVEAALVDDWTHRVIGAAYIADKVENRYFDPKMEAIQRKLEAALPGQSVEIVSSDLARDTYVILSEGPQHPPMYQLFKPELSQLSTLTPQYPGLNEFDLGPVKPYSYKARDGQEIHAYLTLPPGRNAHNLPTVIFPHGGPEARDSLGFDWWAQFMASRGYAVLQPNFRGSTGYGIAFRNAGRGQWGRTMQNDITDGVKQLIADGVADPKRICIVGASYGGYAALAGATFTPDLYACAISYAGISSIPAMIGYISKDSGNNDILYAALNAQVGNVFEGEDNLKAVSPGLHADEVRAPVLLLHSDNDVTVPIVQSEIEQHALQKAGKSVQMITLKGDDHYLGLTETRVQLLKAVESFLEAHIGH